jgi:general secretion pathway protein E
VLNPYDLDDDRLMGNNLSKILIDSGGLKEADVAEAQRLKAEKGGSIADILIQQKNISETQLLQAFSTQFDLPFWPKLPSGHH